MLTSVSAIELDKVGTAYIGDSEEISGEWDFLSTTTWGGGWVNDGITFNEGSDGRWNAWIPNLYLYSINYATMNIIDMNAGWMPSEDNVFPIGQDGNALSELHAYDVYVKDDLDVADAITSSSISATTGDFTDLTVTGTATTEEDLIVYDDFNAGTTGSYPLIYRSAGRFSLFGGTSSGGASMALGVLSESLGAYSTALGFEAVSDGDYSTAIGYQAETNGNYAISMGRYSSAFGVDAVAIGMGAEANLSAGPGGCVAIGAGSYCEDIGIVTLSTDVNVERNLDIGNCITLGGDIICDWGDLNGTASDLNGYMTESTFDANVSDKNILASGDNISELVNDAGYVTTSGGGIGTFMGLTSTAQDGVFAFDGNTGYVAANGMCDGNYSGTHWCTTDEIKASIDDNNYTSFPNGETAWIMEGAPGFISNSNDCVGMTANTATYYGAFWIFDTTRGGDAWLTNCSIKKPLACCG